MGLFGRITKLGRGIVRNARRDDELDELDELEDDIARPRPQPDAAPAPTPKTDSDPAPKKRSL